MMDGKAADGVVGGKMENWKDCWRNRRRDGVGSERLMEES